jgi:F-type H+-transporting ATPase subunit epsilon
MANTIKVEIVSAEHSLYSGDATMVFAPALLGEVGIAPKHTAMLTPLAPGDVRIRTLENEEEVIYVSGGLMEVQPDVVTILSDTAISAQDLDEEAVLRAQEDAQKALAEKGSEMDAARARAELVQAVAQLQALRKIKKG